MKLFIIPFILIGQCLGMNFLELLNQLIPLWPAQAPETPRSAVLPPETVLSIIEQLKMSDLLPVFRANNKYKDIVTRVMKHKFHTKTTKITIKSGTDTKFRTIEEETQINFVDSEKWSILTPEYKIFERFGSSILHLDIHINNLDNDNRHQNINSLFSQINSHCADSLLSLDIYISVRNNHIFDAFSKPFTVLTHLTLFGYFIDLDNTVTHLHFNDLLPALTHLKFNTFEVPTQTWAGRKFKSLTHLQIINFGINPELTVDSFKNLIGNNTAIESLDLNMKSIADGHQLLYFIAITLKKLQRLVLTDYNEGTVIGGEENFSFGQLKAFGTSAVGPILPEKVTFEALKELETPRAYQQTNNLWIPIVQAHTTIKSVIIKENIIDDDIKTITSTLLPLNEITYLCSCHSARKAQSLNYDSAPLCTCNPNVQSIIDLCNTNYMPLNKLLLCSGRLTTNSEFDKLERQAKKQLPAWSVTKVISDKDCVCLKRNEPTKK